MNEKTSDKGVDRWEVLLAGGAALVTVVLWASAFVGIRAAGEDVSPGALSLARLLVGSAALGALVLVRQERFPARRDLPAIALSAGRSGSGSTTSCSTPPSGWWTQARRRCSWASVPS